MNSFLVRACLSFLVLLTPTHLLVAQVIFSRSGRSASAGGIDTTTSLNKGIDRTRTAVLRVSYFDTLARQSVVETAGNQIPSSRIDARLAQSVDSLLVKIERRTGRSGLLSGRTVAWLAAVPAIPPLRMATWQDYRVSSRFGWRIHPVGGNARLHNGVDLPQSTGTPVFATADGVVTGIGWQPGGLGLSVCIKHPTGYQTLYGHLSTYLVKQGDTVRRGRLIGRVGSTGRSTGPHLHYTVLYRGKPVDPAQYCFLWVKLARAGLLQSAGPMRLPNQR